MPASALKILGLGQQSTFGTSTAATQKFMGLVDGSLNVDPKVEIPEVLGNLGAGPLAVLTEISAAGSAEFVACYEMLRYVWNGLFTAITASSSTAAPYVYSYTAPVNSTQVHSIYSLEFGTTGTPYIVAGGILSKATIKGVAGGVWTGSAEFIGKQCSTSTGPASLSDTQATPIRMADTTLYVDVSTGTMGGTSVGATLVSFEWGYETGRHLKTFGGAVTPGDYGEGKHKVTLQTVLEFNASAKAYVDAMIASTPTLIQRQIRIAATQDSSASQKTARLDTAAVLKGGFKLFDDRDGNITVALNWEGWYSTALANVAATYVECTSSGTP